MAQLDQGQQQMLRILLAATNQLPKYKAEKGELWRSFETSFRLKLLNTGLDTFALDIQKRALLGCLEGKAARAHVLMGEDSQAYQNAANINAFILELRNLFQPPAESELARLEFEGMRQGARQPITSYHSAKMVAYAQAVPNPGANNFSYLRTQMLKGIYSSYVKQRVIEAGCVNEAQLLQTMVAAAANAMEAYSLDTGVITNLDGLASTTNFEIQDQYGEEPMDINRIGDDKCFNCDGKGHHARNCPKPKKERRERDTQDKDKKVVVCDFCDFKGHHVSVCRKKKVYKEEQAKIAAKRTIKKTEEEEEEDYTEPSDEEGNEDFVEDNSINVINEGFWTPTGHIRGTVLRREDH